MIKIIEPLVYPQGCNSFYFPEDDGDVEAGYRRAKMWIEEVPWKYYSTAEMLKKYKEFPDVIDFIADMI